MKDGQTMTAPGSQGSPGQGAGGSSAKRPWDVEIDVHLTKGCPNPQFELHTPLPTSNGEIIFKNNHRPGFNISFNLIDKTGEGYTFPSQPNVDDACWSQYGTTCPTTACKDVFEPRRIKNQGMTLEVYNDNPSPPGGPFKFNLRVTKDGGQNYCDLDPDGNNQNGAQN